MMKVPKNPYALSLFTYTHYMRKPIHIFYAFLFFLGFTDENEPAVASNNEDEEDDGIYKYN